eukprot:PITA_33097
MVEEYDSIIQNSVWDVVPKPRDKSVVSSRWLYKVKQATDGSVEKHKARFVARGFSQLIKSCKEDLAREFEMKDMGLMHYFLGMEVWQKDGEIFVSQGKYANEILRCFHMEKCKPMQTPLVGKWRKEDATSGETEGVKLQGFTDVDWTGSPSNQKSTSGGIFNLGLVVVSWYSRKQRSVALSSAEAEYMDSSQVASEAIWMWEILVGLFGQMMDTTAIYCDNQSYIKFFENPVFHDRSKHIDIRYHHLRDCVVKRIMMLQSVQSKTQLRLNGGIV